MKQTYEIADLLNSSPVANHILSAAALAINFFALIQSSFRPRLALVIVCSIALCIPVYDLIEGYMQAKRAGTGIPAPFTSAFIYFTFAPGYLALIAILLRIKFVKNTRSLAVASFLCIITSWVGVTFLYFVLS